jgi:non-canonical purine NTP pyrophosphatase (RdgB/HAM1 family)
MSKEKLAIVTGNKLKFEEISKFLDEYFDCEQVVLKDLVEIQGTPEEILTHKMHLAYNKLCIPVLVDDTSLHFEALGGFPGPYAKDMFVAMTPLAMGQRFKGTRIEAVCRLGIMYNNDDFIIAKGSLHGSIIEPKDNNHNGREFDLFLLADGMDKPVIEYNAEEKNKFSHRGRALQDLVLKLSQRNK